MELEIYNFNNNPLLKELMTNYYGIKYETSPSESDLLAELYWLVKTNNLHEIFICETMNNEWENSQKVTGTCP